MDLFEPPLDRRPTSSSKWNRYAGRDVLPFWVADMDLPCAPFILDAVRERLDHPILGYTEASDELNAAFIDWAAEALGWAVQPEWLVWIPGVVPGFNLAARALAGRGTSLVIPTPAYHPFLRVPAHASLDYADSPLVRVGDRWEMDFDHLAALMPDAAGLLFCNPQNPTGRVYERHELEALAALALEHDTVLISDEIHCGIVLDPKCRHLSIAALEPAVANKTISLFAATKTYNFAGLNAAIAVIPDATLRERFSAERKGLVSNISPLAYAATLAAYRDRSDWVGKLNAFLAENERLVRAAVERTNVLSMTPVEGTYLGWIDARAVDPDDPTAFFEAHGLGFSPGEDFGGRGFVRFNFACSRSLLERGIERLEAAVRSV